MNRPPFIMQSNGGIVTVGAARRNPVALAESGPAAGVLGAVAVGLGLTASLEFDTPSGPSIVVAAFVIFLLTMLPVAAGGRGATRAGRSEP